MRLVNADALANDLEYDAELDSRALDDTTIVGSEREKIQFDKDCKQNCIWYLTNAPTIEERRKGRWMDMSEGFSPYKCSECGAVEFKKSNYCPNCGAKMEGESE